MNSLSPLLLLILALLGMAAVIVWGLEIRLALQRRRRPGGRKLLAAVLAGGPVLPAAGYFAHTLGRPVAVWTALQGVALAAAVGAAANLPAGLLGPSLLIDLGVVMALLGVALSPLLVLAAAGPAGKAPAFDRAAPTVLEAQDLRKSYRMGQRDVHVLRGVSLTVRSGEFLAILGASGSGKSTLLHLLGLLDNPDEGRLTLGGIDTHALRPSGRDATRCRDIGFVFQFYHLLPELNVLENTLLPVLADSSPPAWLGRRKAAAAGAREMLTRFGLAHRLDHRPRELSGGECQRVAIARALINRPALLLADEPTGNLDSKTGGEIIRALRDLNEQTGQTIVLVTHDASIAALAHRVVHLRDGRIQ